MEEKKYTLTEPQFRKLYNDLINAGRDMEQRDALNLYYLPEEAHFDSIKTQFSLPLESKEEEKKPLSNITDEDAIEVAKILKPNDEHTHDPEYGKMYARQLFGGVMYSVDKCFALQSFLQSKNYELPIFYTK
jgi:hypothetical protein